jgi:hypothetical protein
MHAVIPTAGATALPVHASQLVRPARPVTKPTGQVEHANLPLLPAALPAGHALQLPAPVLDAKEPGKQGTHVA